MLFAACGSCRNIVPLFCSGGFPPHSPLPVFQGAFGAQCPCCGPLQPWFVCECCGQYQMLFFPSLASSQNPAQLGIQVPLAPTVQAPMGTGTDQLNGLVIKALGSFLNSAASEAGEAVGGALAGWFQDDAPRW